MDGIHHLLLLELVAKGLRVAVLADDDKLEDDDAVVDADADAVVVATVTVGAGARLTSRFFLCAPNNLASLTGAEEEMTSTAHSFGSPRIRMGTSYLPPSRAGDGKLPCPPPPVPSMEG